MFNSLNDTSVHLLKPQHYILGCIRVDTWSTSSFLNTSSYTRVSWYTCRWTSWTHICIFFTTTLKKKCIHIFNFTSFTQLLTKVGSETISSSLCSIWKSPFLYIRANIWYCQTYSFARYMFCQYLLPDCGLHFNLLMVSFCWEKLLYFRKSHLSFYYGLSAVYGVAKSRTRLSDFTFTFHFHTLEKEMATHASVLAWRIPGMGELAAIYGVTQSRTWLKWLSSSSSSTLCTLLKQTFPNSIW